MQIQSIPYHGVNRDLIEYRPSIPARKGNTMPKDNTTKQTPKRPRTPHYKPFLIVRNNSAYLANRPQQSPELAEALENRKAWLVAHAKISVLMARCEEELHAASRKVVELENDCLRLRGAK